jgi:branched-chain amino acid transport system permease protein
MEILMLKRWRERMTPTDVVMWSIGGAILALMIWGSAATLTEGRYTSHHWFDFIIFGLAQGSIYALIAMGIPWSMEFFG